MIRHSTVFKQDGVFAGWPANHGAWQWGNEFLVGFMTGPYTKKPRTHQISEPFKKLQARSVDGGETWVTEDPEVDFEASFTTEPVLFDIQKDIIRVCGIYDHGGEYCCQGGGFYISKDKGRSWTGTAKPFNGIDGLFSSPYENSSRTEYIPQDGLLFITNRLEGNFGTDSAFCAKYENGSFYLVGGICVDKDRAAMPSATKIGSNIFVAMRRTNFIRYWLECFASYDGGVNWHSLSDIATTSNRNGNPPALIASGNSLVCAYGERDDGSIRTRISDDYGCTWREGPILRSKGKSDIGYPQLLKREDGRLVCIYYWASGTGDQQGIESTIFDI